MGPRGERGACLHCTNDARARTTAAIQSVAGGRRRPGPEALESRERPNPCVAAGRKSVNCSPAGHAGLVPIELWPAEYAVANDEPLQPADRGSSRAKRGAYWTLALLIAINLLNYVDRSMLAALELRIQQDLFAPGNPAAGYWLSEWSVLGWVFNANAELWIGLLPTAFLFSYMLASPVFGWLADHTRRWAIVGVGVILWSLASGGSGLAATYGMLLASRLCVGVGEAAYGPAAPTLIADQFPVDHRARMLAYFYIAIPVGSALGYVYGAAFAGESPWHWAFYLSVPPGLLLGAVALLQRDPPRGASDPTRTNRPARLGDYLTFLRTPSYVLATAGMTAWTFAVGGIAFWMPRYVSQFRGAYSLRDANLWFGAITVVSGIAATFLGGWTADRLRSRWPGSYFLVSGVSTLLAVPAFLATLATPFPAAWWLVFLTEFCLFFNTGPSNAILANVTHPAVRASAFAVNILLIHLFGDAFSPPLIGKLTGVFQGDMNRSFEALSGVMLLGGALWLCGTPFLARDTQRAPTLIGPDERAAP